MAMLTDKSKVNRFKLAAESKGSERREHRRYELGGQTLSVNRWDGRRREAMDFGYLVDLSAGGVRVRTNQPNIKQDHQIRVRLEMPAMPASARLLRRKKARPSRRTNGSVGWPSAVSAKRRTANTTSAAA